MKNYIEYIHNLLVHKAEMRLMPPYMTNQKHNVTAEDNEQVEEMLEKYTEGNDRATRVWALSPDIVIEDIANTLTKLIADTEKKRDEELIAWIETECMYDDLIIKNQLLAHLKEK